MKKIICLTAAFVLATSMVTFAAGQESHCRGVADAGTYKSHDHSCIIAKNFELYTSLIGLNKEEVLNSFYEKPLFIEEGGLCYSNNGVVINFENHGIGPVTSISVEKKSVDFNGAKVGDTISEFKKRFNTVIDKDEVEGYYSFEYEGKLITVFYHPGTQRVLSVHISNNNIQKTPHETRSNVVTFGDDNNGVYFGNNIKYELSETSRDIKLEEAISAIYHLQRGVDKLSYYYNHVDLNADNNMETFVYLVGPSVSGSGGSSALLFTNKDGEYQLVSRFTLVRNPIIISNNTTNGWRDIIMPVSGGGSGKFFAELKFDGIQYPENPSIQPKLEVGRVVVGTAIVADDIMKNQGIQF